MIQLYKLLFLFLIMHFTIKTSENSCPNITPTFQVSNLIIDPNNPKNILKSENRYFFEGSGTPSELISTLCMSDKYPVFKRGFPISPHHKTILRRYPDGNIYLYAEITTPQDQQKLYEQVVTHLPQLVCYCLSNSSQQQKHLSAILPQKATKSDLTNALDSARQTSQTLDSFLGLRLYPRIEKSNIGIIVEADITTGQDQQKLYDAFDAFCKKNKQH